MLNKEEKKNTKRQRWIARYFCNFVPQTKCPRMVLMSGGSFSELSRYLVKWLLNSLYFLPLASHHPKCSPWGREGSDPCYPFAKSLGEVVGLNRFVFEKGSVALARKAPQKCQCLQFVACWRKQELNCFKLEFQGLWLVSGIHNNFFWKHLLLYRLLFVPSVSYPT